MRLKSRVGSKVGHSVGHLGIPTSLSLKSYYIFFYKQAELFKTCIWTSGYSWIVSQLIPVQQSRVFMVFICMTRIRCSSTPSIHTTTSVNAPGMNPNPNVHHKEILCAPVRNDKLPSFTEWNGMVGASLRHGWNGNKKLLTLLFPFPMVPAFLQRRPLP